MQLLLEKVSPAEFSVVSTVCRQYCEVVTSAANFVCLASSL